jgi:hypothetical protein
MYDVDQSYASHTWAFLDRIGSHIRLEPTTWTRPQRVGNRFIMDEDVTNLPGIKPIELVYPTSLPVLGCHNACRHLHQRWERTVRMGIISQG